MRKTDLTPGTTIIFCYDRSAAKLHSTTFRPQSRRAYRYQWRWARTYGQCKGSLSSEQLSRIQVHQ